MTNPSATSQLTHRDRMPKLIPTLPQLSTSARGANGVDRRDVITCLCVTKNVQKRRQPTAELLTLQPSNGFTEQKWTNLLVLLDTHKIDLLILTELHVDSEEPPHWFPISGWTFHSTPGPKQKGSSTRYNGGIGLIYRENAFTVTQSLVYKGTHQATHWIVTSPSLHHALHMKNW
jgi:hypothetical protein